jgi:catechol 2,3-dioxygenase-like lactoylglutathione lyase family enzyme
MPRLDHVNIQARDTKAMVAFLEAVVEAREGFRPPFKNPGHWLYLEGHPFIHIDIPARDDDFPQGLVNHIAFGIYDKTEALARVEKTGFRYEHAEIPGTGIGQIFVYGPEGVKIELQYRQ